MWKSLIDILPRGNTLSEADWQRRHRLLQWVLLVHVPVLAVIGLALGNPPLPLAIALTIPVLCAVAGRLLRQHRRLGSGAVTAGLVWCSTVLVGITNGTIESASTSHHHRLHRALPGLGAVPAEPSCSPWSPTASARCGCAR
jgi:hypothetical protein